MRNRMIAAVVLFVCAWCAIPAVGQSPEWVQAQLAGRTGHAMAFDSARGRTVLFGGIVPAGTTATGGLATRYDDATWEWDGNSWTQLPAYGPSTRSQMAMAYDSTRGVTVLFGGTNGSNVSGETWEWNGLVWTQRTVSGPSPRYAHAMVYDAARGVTVLFGGNGGQLGVNAETWEWDGSVWSHRQVSGPLARSLHAMAYDSVRHKTVMFGGLIASSGQRTNETWEWDGATWTRNLVTGPSARTTQAMAYDPTRGVVVLFGGLASTMYLGDAWEWNGLMWNQRQAPNPPIRAGHAMAFDAARNQIVLFGGIGGPFNYYADTWRLDATGWTQYVASSVFPSARYGHAMIYDSSRGVTVLFGGTPSLGLDTSDTWEWNGAAWNQRALGNPSDRHGHAMAFDSFRAVTVLFGGANAFNNDTWEWNGAAWADRHVGGPTLRYGHAMAYDSSRHVTVLFGGLVGSMFNDETWEWDGATWAQRVVAGPSPRADHAMAYDASRRVTVLFGGRNGANNPLGETWEWDGATWAHRLVSEPSPRFDSAMVYDSVRSVVVLFGGWTGAAGNAETQEWNGSAWTPLTLSSPSPRDYHAMAFDTARGSTVLFGGVTANGGWNGETWNLIDPCFPPTINFQPESAIACNTSAAHFGIVLGGTFPVSCQWQVQTDPDTWQSLANDPGPLPCGGGAFAYAAPINSPSVTIGIRPCPGSPGAVQHFQVRCLVSNACGSVTSNEATYIICPADFNCSGGPPTVSDIFAFLSAWFAHDSAADFNGDTQIMVNDIFAFLSAWFTGC